MSEQQFAFGFNEVDGCECPAVQADMDPTENIPLNEAAAKYDNYMEETTGEMQGVTDEETAKEAWLHAVMFSESKSSRIQAKWVAEELGWLDDE